jgi:pimeloyl-ACP methyl ester carboxylesterase
MPEKYVILIEGLGDPGTSPIDQLAPRLFNALASDVQIRIVHYSQVEAGESGLPLDEFVPGMKLKVIGHSLGAYAAIWLAMVLQAKGITVELVLLDPVTGDEQHPWAQFGAPALVLPGNVTGCTCYLRTMFTWLPPYHQGLAVDDGHRFVNVQVPWADHNSIVAAKADQIVLGCQSFFREEISATDERG